jgi:hypothetical protein
VEKQPIDRFGQRSSDKKSRPFSRRRSDVETALYVTHNKRIADRTKVVLRVLVWHLPCFTLKRCSGTTKYSHPCP